MIDERSLSIQGQWPWPRDEMSELVGRLGNAGALAIAFDMVFAEPDRTNPSRLANELDQTIADPTLRTEIVATLNRLPDNDQIFAETLAKYPVVLGFFDATGNETDAPIATGGLAWVGSDLSKKLPVISGVVSSLPILSTAAKGHGSISLGANSDDIVRQVPLFVRSEEQVFPALSIEAIRIALSQATGQKISYTIRTTEAALEGGSGQAALTVARLGNFEIPVTADGGFNIYFGKAQPSRVYSAVDVLRASKQTLSSIAEDKIVLIGASAAGLRDIRVTPLRENLPGVEIHAQVIDQIMEGNFLNRPDWAPGFEAALGMISAVLVMLFLHWLSAPLAGGLAGLSLAAIVGVSWVAFSQYGLLIDPSPGVVVTILAYGLTTLLLYAFTEREKRFIRNAFQHYLSPHLVSKLEQDPTALKLGGEIRDVTVMFMDVRDFTSISEKLSPEELVTFLNRLLSPLTEIIQDHEGAIDKYIGDSIMAFWNAPLSVEDHPTKACLAALQMIRSVALLNADDAFRFKSKGLPEVRIGIGISTGQGCVGNMGSSDRFDYSIVGDTVNLAARLESASKEIGSPIIVSSETANNAIGLSFRPVGALKLKGKSLPVEAFALLESSGTENRTEIKGNSTPIAMHGAN